MPRCLTPFITDANTYLTANVELQRKVLTLEFTSPLEVTNLIEITKLEVEERLFNRLTCHFCV